MPPRKKKKGREPRPASLLILECNTAKLAAQSITMARDLRDRIKTWMPDTKLSFVPTTSRQALLSALAQCKQKNGQYNVIVIVGHGSVRGLQLTHDPRVPWEEVARWINPFKPKQIVLVACEAGRWLPSKALFEGVLTLQEIYGSPVVITQQEASAIKLLVPYLLMGGYLPDDILRMAQVANFLSTDGVLFRQIREEFQQTGVVEGTIWTVLEEAMKAFYRRWFQ